MGIFMETVAVDIKIDPEYRDLPLPKYHSLHSAGMDLYACVPTVVVLKARERMMISTGISVALPPGYEAQIRPRSGLAASNGISIVNTPGTIDSDFRGVIQVILINHSNQDFPIQRGDRIAQMVISRFSHAEWHVVKELDTTARGEGGFGSTGKEVK